MGEGGTPGPATKGRWTWAWVVGLIGLVAAFLSSPFSRRGPTRRNVLRVTRSRSYVFSPENLDSASSDLQRAVSNRVVPGAALAIGDRTRIVELTGYGRVGWRPSDEAVSPDSTIYDLASLTKAVATTSATLLLIQDGRIGLDDPVQRWLPEFTGTLEGARDVAASADAHGGIAGRREGSRALVEPASRECHRHAARRTARQHRRSIPMSAPSFSGPRPSASRANRCRRFSSAGCGARWACDRLRSGPAIACENCAPTLSLKSGEPYRGKPSDPVAHKIGMPTGNAGLFSTAHDLARFAAMMANGGTLGDVRIFRPDLVRELVLAATSRRSPHARLDRVLPGRGSHAATGVRSSDRLRAHRVDRHVDVDRPRARRVGGDSLQPIVQREAPAVARGAERGRLYGRRRPRHRRRRSQRHRPRRFGASVDLLTIDSQRHWGRMSSDRPTILIIGATGQTGRLIVADFDHDPATPVCASPPRKNLGRERPRRRDYVLIYAARRGRETMSVNATWRVPVPDRARSRNVAALISARCVNACGKFPRCSPLDPSCSEYRPRWFAYPSILSKSRRAFSV